MLTNKLTNNWLKKSIVLIVAALLLLNFNQPAMAHHPLGGKTPATFLEGFMSGLGHPVLGLDHFAFVIASGLIAVGLSRGILIPCAFAIATMIGAGIHLMSIDLPIPEIIISLSVILFGVLLVIRQVNPSKNYTYILTGIGAIAGLFHGFAYGEGIFGAEPTPLVAYLIGLTLIQLGIAIVVYYIATAISQKINPQHWMRLAGLAISAIGFVFLSATFA